MTRKVILPAELTAENGAKYNLVGEFEESIEVGEGVTYTALVKWTTIKEIYRRIVDSMGIEPYHLPEEFLIWSWEHKGWWAPNERGYIHPDNFADAGRYPSDHAFEICFGANQFEIYGECREEMVLPLQAERFKDAALNRNTGEKYG